MARAVHGLVFLGLAACSGAAAAPQTPAQFEAVLEPGVVRVIGSRIEAGENGCPAGAAFGVHLRFEAEPGAPALMERDILIRLGPHDVLRAPLAPTGQMPGAAFERSYRVRVPRGADIGRHPLRVGLVRENAPGETRTSFCARLMPLGTLGVQPAQSPPRELPESLDAIRASLALEEPRNLLDGGGFENGFRGWEVGEGIREGLVGWDRVLTLTLDPNVAAAGQQSMRIDFHGGQDPNFFHVVQEAAVRPATRYVVRYALKTENLTSNEGPSVAVRDPDVPLEEFYVATPKALRLTGTHGWTLVAFPFETGPYTKRVRVILRRDGSGAAGYAPRRFGPISGSAWFDGVQLVPAQEPVQ